MLNSPLLPIFLTVFVDVLGLTLMLPVLPLYAESFHATAFVATLLGASYAACQLFSGPLLGRLSDRVGRKPVLLASQMGTFGAFLVIASARHLWMLFLGRMLDGMTAGNLSIAQAYISDVTKPQNRTRAFALIGIAFGAGFTIGPAIAGWLVGPDKHFERPAYLAACLSLTSILLTIRLIPNKEQLEKLKAEHGSTEDGPAAPAGERNLAFGRFFSRPLPRRRLLQFFTYTTSFAVLTGGLALFLERKLPEDKSIVYVAFTVSGVMGGMINGGLIGRLVKKLGETKLALIGFLTMAAGYPLLGAVDGRPKLFALIVVSSFGVAVVRPCLTTLLTRSVSRREQGEALGTSQSLSSISQMIGQPLAGYLIGSHALNLYGYGIAAASFALLGALLTLQPEPAAEPAPPASEAEQT